MTKINSIPFNPISNPRNSPSPSPIQISVPNPPTIKPLDYIRKKSNGKWPTKPPNSFILYRIAYSRELKLNNVKLSIQETSKLVSNSWDNEKKSVKTAYKNLAVEIDKKLLDLRNENSISDQDIYFYNHDHLSIEQLKDYYFSNQQFTVSATNTKTNAKTNTNTDTDSSFLPSFSRESQQVNSSIGNSDNNAHNITNIKAVNNNDDDHRDFMQQQQQQQQQDYDYTSLSAQDSNNIDNANNIVAVNETNNNVDNISGLNSNYVVDVNNDDVRTIEQNYHHQSRQQQQQHLNSSMNINYSLPNIRNDYQSVYKFNNSSDIGLIATTPNENVFSTNFLFDYQNKGQHFIDISNYEINNNDNYINNLNNFNANNSNNNHLNNIDSNNFNFNNTDNSYNFNFNSNHSNDFISNNDTHSNNNNFNCINNDYFNNNNNNEFQDFLYY